jgi:hypothetical protein
MLVPSSSAPQLALPRSVAQNIGTWHQDRDGVFSERLFDIHSMFGDFQSQHRKRKKGRLLEPSDLESASGTSPLNENRGASALVEDSQRMNARPEIRDALLVQKMKHWLIRARHGPLGNCPKWKAKKNYWALIRRHRQLAQQHGLRETDVF